MKSTLMIHAYIFALLAMLIPVTIKPLSIGSTLLVSLQPLISFPAADLDNGMVGFAWFKNGFTLEDESTTCIFDSVYPVSGAIDMNSGTLSLNQDLHFSNVTTLNSLGKIIGNGHFVEFPTSITSFPSGTNTFQDTKVFVNNDLSLTSTILFQGTCIFNGNGHTIDLSTGNIIVGAGGSLTLTNMTLKNIMASNIKCLDDAGTITLDNVVWQQDGTFTFTHGGINFNNTVDFEGDEIFAYQSLITSTVLANATVTLDHGFTFSYDPGTSADLLQFEDISSVLQLKTNSVLHATIQGLNLQKGRMYVQGNSSLSSEIWVSDDLSTIIDNGITVGDCQNVSNDFTINLEGSVQLSVTSGSWNYKNISPNSLIIQNNITGLFIGDDTSLNIYQNLNMGNAITTFGNNATLARAPGFDLLGSISTEGSLNFINLPNC